MSGVKCRSVINIYKHVEKGGSAIIKRIVIRFIYINNITTYVEQQLRKGWTVGCTTKLISPIYSYLNYLPSPWSCSIRVNFSDVIHVLTHPVVLSLMFKFVE